MFCWGFGDFLIQKSTRKFGDWETLFLISIVGAILLLPFIYYDLPNVFAFQNNSFFVLLLASCILLGAALLDFEALKKGKLAVVEPLWSLEIPISTLLAFFIVHESISYGQGGLIALLVFGLILVSLRSYHLEKRVWLEKGTLLALLAAITMGSANFFVGIGARATNALMMNWFLSTFLAIISFSYLIYHKKFLKLFKDFRENKRSLVSMCILDNVAWIAFAFSMVLAPIAIAVALSESYIIIAVLLGMYVNKEFLRIHQKIGLVIAIISAIILAILTQ